MNQRFHMMVAIYFLVCLSGAFFCNPAQAVEKKGKERLAVLDLEPKYGIDKGLAEALSVIVRDKLHSFGDYQVMSKGDIQAVASREQLMQAMGCDDGGSQCLVDFGRAIGTRFMVAGDISKIGSTYTVSLRMFDTKGERAGVINRVSEDCKCDEDALIGTVRDVAARLVGKPTATALKKVEEEKKLAEERKKTEETEQKRAVEEKRRADELLKKSEAETTRRLIEEKKKADKAEQQRLAAEIEKVKIEKEPLRMTANQKPAMPVVEKPGLTVGTTPAETYTDPTTGMEFVYVPGGCFQMGNTIDGGDSGAKPVHEVCVNAFSMGKYEVTQGEYAKVTGNNPSNFKRGDRYPVEQVSWDDAQTFIRILNGKSGKSYRLPTEAEWEYAARFGGKSEKYAGGDDLDALAWYTSNSGASTHPVGQKRPNNLGLYDMTGNVEEWCGDWFDSSYYGKSPRNNPQGPSSSLYRSRVKRGGGWFNNIGFMHTASRYINSPGVMYFNLGFRLVLPVQQP